MQAGFQNEFFGGHRMNHRKTFKAHISAYFKEGNKQLCTELKDCAYETSVSVSLLTKIHKTLVFTEK